MRVSNPLANSYTKNQADNQFLTIDTSGSESGTPNPINADTLNGKPASDYVLKNELYPVGSIYMSINSTDPANYFGGVWQRIKKAFLFAADDESYVAGNTGGEEETTLSIQQIPSHTHKVMAGSQQYYTQYVGTGSGSYQISEDRSPQGKEPLAASATGGGQPHNNMPPYLVVYMWQRMS